MDNMDKLKKARYLVDNTVGLVENMRNSKNSTDVSASDHVETFRSLILHVEENEDFDVPSDSDIKKMSVDHREVWEAYKRHETATERHSLAQLAIDTLEKYGKKYGYVLD